ncbi:M50 family metallopeptidase [Paenibacillus marinisediminis]
MNKWLKTLIFIVVAAVLTRWIPYSSFFRNVDTMIHEFGHALMTLVLSGKVMYIHLFADYSGVTYSTVTDSWKFIPIALAGYTTSALFASLMFALYRRNQLKIGLIAVTLVTLVSVVFFVRNEFGVLWCIGFIVINVIAYLVPWEWLRQGYYLLIAFILMVESVISTLTILAASVTQPLQAGDAANLYNATGVHSIVWALLFVAIALVCARMSMRSFLGRGGKAGYATRSGGKRRRSM